MSQELVAVVTSVLSTDRSIDRSEMLECRLLLAEQAVQLGAVGEAQQNLAAAMELIDMTTAPAINERLDSVRQALAGRAECLNTDPTQVEAEPLSRREVEILVLAARGLSRREIGDNLYLSVNTVKTHFRNIFRKLGVSSREEALVAAMILVDS